MSRMKKVEAKVREILIADPATRNDDTLLYLRFCENENAMCSSLSFRNVLLNRDALGLPKYDSVTRARRKCQRKHPELKASKKVEDGRYENWKEYRDYALE